ncbi:unnamed protein product [Calypogeia fissa]
MGGVAAKIVAGPDSAIRMISITEANDEALDEEEWEHASELPRDLSMDEGSCYRVSTRTEKCQQRLKKLKDKHK